MRTILGLAGAAMLAGILLAWPAGAAGETPAEAATLEEALTGGKLLLQLRPRWEYVAQDGKAEDANAFTMRTLLGWRTKPWHGLSVTVEGINVGHFGSRDYNDDPAAASPYPVVADPERRRASFTATDAKAREGARGRTNLGR
jgi:hypothetical protein